ncbi:hypothetical protein ILUMI_21759 [Ignelater luminosus]|uniref:Uncharacterized protein n=1 Tax=Ignelater luminosus TaxID=2038154 RepID=A0A8K0CIA3_IGNLU|nr:hypothetical protein ILUMI_21759 [Ignelater luminosus]
MSGTKKKVAEYDNDAFTTDKGKRKRELPKKNRKVRSLTGTGKAGITNEKKRLKDYDNIHNKEIHKAPWTTPNGITTNQIDHVLVEAKHMKTEMNARRYREANADNNHVLIRVKLKIAKPPKRKGEQTRIKANIESLRKEAVRETYHEATGENIQIDSDIERKY